MTIPYPPPNSNTGAAVLDEVATFLGRFVAFPNEHCLPTVVLWAAHTHAPRDTFYVTPRLVLDSAEPGSGKTRVLELLNLLVQSPEMTISATVAAIFRMIADNPITLLFDEVDAIFNPKNGGNFEDLRAMLNAGYKQGNTIARCVGDAKSMKVEKFPVFAPVALAGIAGKMPATITTRAVTVHMRKRGPDEKVAPFRERDAEVEAKPLREQLAEWVSSVSPDLSYARPRMPKGVEDRPAEVWEALLAVADAAGGDWPKKARAACSSFVLNSDPGALSIGVRLLIDVRCVLTGHGVAHMPTADLLAELNKLDESPWGTFDDGKGLSARRLSVLLDRYDVRPVQFKDAGTKLRGYVTWPTENPRQVGLLDAWNRYLDSGGTPGTAGTPQASPVPDVDAVPGQPGTDNQPGTGLSSEVPDVPGVPLNPGPTAADNAETPPPSVQGAWRVSGRPIDDNRRSA